MSKKEKSLVIKPEPKTIIFFKDDGFIGDAICAAQNIYWHEYGKESQWSHIGFVGSDGMFYESTVRKGFKTKVKRVFGIKFKYKVPAYIYGVTSMPAEKRLKKWWKHYEQIGIQYDFKTVSDEDWDLITKYAQYLIKNKTKYGGFELFGTLVALIEWRLTSDPKKKAEILKKDNPVNTENVYCIATVADCFLKGAAIHYIDPGINSSISTVDHGWWTPLKCKSKIIRRS